MNIKASANITSTIMGLPADTILEPNNISDERYGEAVKSFVTLKSNLMISQEKK